MKPFIVMSAAAFFIASPALAQTAAPANDFVADAREENANSAADPKVKDFASQTLPVLQKHLDAAWKLASDGK